MNKDDGTEFMDGCPDDVNYDGNPSCPLSYRTYTRCQTTLKQYLFTELNQISGSISDCKTAAAYTNHYHSAALFVSVLAFTLSTLDCTCKLLVARCTPFISNVATVLCFSQDDKYLCKVLEGQLGR